MKVVGLSNKENPRGIFYNLTNSAIAQIEKRLKIRKIRVVGY
jgi:hypothetical protein